MDAYSTESDISYSEMPPVLIAGSSERAVIRARSTVQAFGVRTADARQIGAAAPCLQEQASASAIWVELDEISAGEIIDQLVEQLNDEVRQGRYGAIVAAPEALIDPLAATLDDEVQLLIGADDAERAAALAIALARRQTSHRYDDVASDRNAERLRQLSDEVSRIASTLARLSAGPGAPQRPVEKSPVAEAPEVSAETIRAVIRARRLRARYFPDELFADPAWDMLLDLLQAEIAQLRVPVSSLCIAASVPATTALRWLKTLVQQGIFVRRADPHDGRRVFVELAPDTSNALRRYFAEVGQVAVI
jgi:DNA-binding MarR family transcriptional regulator